MNILLCVTGSVAASVTDKVVDALKEVGEVRVAMTDSACRFMSSETLREKTLVKVFTDKDEWKNWDVSKTVLHIEMKNWADVIVFAPLSANTLAKMAMGMCDNLVTCIFRACPPEKKIVLALAMNTDMWNNSITDENIDAIDLRYNYVDVVPCTRKKLACGDTGMGAMADAETIAETVKDLKRNFAIS